MPGAPIICGQTGRSGSAQRRAVSARRSAAASSTRHDGKYRRKVWAISLSRQRQVCSNARGSCWETLDHVITGNDEGFIATELLNQGRMLVNEAVKVLNGYMSYLKRAHRTRVTTDNG